VVEPRRVRRLRDNAGKGVTGKFQPVAETCDRERDSTLFLLQDLFLMQYFLALILLHTVQSSFFFFLCVHNFKVGRRNKSREFLSKEPKCGFQILPSN
jgi:hypothetical protein